MKSLQLMLRAILTISLITGLSLASTAVSAQEKGLTHKEEKRRYIVYTPVSYANNPDKKYPLVLNFHGGGMTMREQMLYTQMNKTAEQFDFIVVYPQGLGNVGKQDWNVGFDTSYHEGTDDVGFTDSLLNQLEKNLRIDTSRIYATGLSRGGFFAQRLAAELSHRIAAIASVGASLPIPVEKNQTPRGEKKPVGILIAMGTADQVVAYTGKAEGYLSAIASYEYWIQQNTGKARDTSIETKQYINRDPNDGTEVDILESKAGTFQTSLVSIHQGGHTWAGADPFNIGLPIGKTSNDINLNEVIWQFFQKHRR
ncbi:alpha/beta hydrolase family esterase [Undibacterium baiyunense]|nr:PHB depolymerase family esterase [Undibacterium baiyunense]